MLNEFHRLHVVFDGDPAQAAAWLPFAKSKVRDLLKAQGAFGMWRNQSQQYLPAEGVVVRVRIVGEDKFVRISATSGCTDRLGFLLSRRSTFTALYNDGVSEPVDAIVGPRTKGFLVPDQLQFDQTVRRSASKYSGIMREAVGCYHAASKDAPFSCTHGVTHGIVKKSFTSGAATVVQYWVVEISPLGVYAAPVAVTERCCDSWNVSAYMATKAQIALNPLLATLSLRTAFVLHKARVRQLLSATEMATAYGDGSPWFDDCGWAFSASGAEAQNVVSNVTAVSGVPYYLMSRWKVSFSLNSGHDLSAVVTPMERNKTMLTLHAHTMWVPAATGAGLWDGIDGASNADITTTGFTAQNAPVHVFYKGETEVVTRWFYSRTDVAQFDRSGLPIDSIPVTKFGAACGDYDTVAIVSGHSGVRINAHTLTTCGFSSVGFSLIDDSYSTGTIERAYDGIEQPEVTSEFSNLYSLQPPCYYVDPVSGLLVTSCSSTFQFVKTFTLYRETHRVYTASSGHATGLVFFAEERDALLGVSSTTVAASGSVDSSPTQQASFVSTTTKIDGGLCPWLGKDEAGTGADFSGVIPVIPAEPFSSSVTTGFATLLFADHAVSVADITGKPDLTTFLSYNATTKPTAESNVAVMHGNLYYPDATLVPMLQRDNYVYRLDNAQIVSGGFAQPDNPVGFVGKA